MTRQLTRTKTTMTRYIVLTLFCFSVALATTTSYSTNNYTDFDLFRLSAIEPNAANDIDLLHERAYEILEELKPFVPVPSPITNWCYAWLHQFAYVAANFAKCSVQHARPFRFCRNCVAEYLKSKNFITDLIAQDEKLAAEKRCFPRLINSDTINIVGKMSDFMSNVWDDAGCKYCFERFEFDNGTIDAELTNITKQYVHQLNNTNTCLDSYIYYKNGTEHYDPYACKECSKSYVKLNNIYRKMNQENGTVCMDVADAMNYTRYLWSKDFQCNLSDPNEAQVYGTCAAIFTLPIFFYVISKFQGAIRRKRLMKLKRLNLKRGSVAHANLLRSASLVYSDQVHNVGTHGRPSVVDEVNARRLNITPTPETDHEVPEARSSDSDSNYPLILQ